MPSVCVLCSVLAELEPQPRYLEDDSVEERVVGGQVARPNSWPWQVKLFCFFFLFFLFDMSDSYESGVLVMYRNMEAVLLSTPPTLNCSKYHIDQSSISRILQHFVVLYVHDRKVQKVC